MCGKLWQVIGFLMRSVNKLQTHTHTQIKWKKFFVFILHFPHVIFMVLKVEASQATVKKSLGCAHLTSATKRKKKSLPYTLNKKFIKLLCVLSRREETVLLLLLLSHLNDARESKREWERGTKTIARECLRVTQRKKAVIQTKLKSFTQFMRTHFPGQNHQTIARA